MAAYTGMLALQQWGLCTLGGFMQSWGVVFIVVTVLVALYKHERIERKEDDLSILEAYQQMYQVLTLPNVKRLLFFLVTCKIGFAASDSLTIRELLRRGMPKEDTAYMGALLTPIAIVLPGLVSTWTANRPLNLFTSVYTPRLFLGVLAAAAVYFCPSSLCLFYSPLLCESVVGTQN